MHAHEFRFLQKDVDLKKHMIATCLISGSSGGVILRIDGNGSDKVLGIILKGYPKQYYTDPRVRGNITGCCLVDIMLPIEEIFNDIHWQPGGKELLSNLFDISD